SWNIFILIFMIPFILLAFGADKVGEAYPLLVFAFVYILTITPFNYDMQRKSYMIIESLPIKKKDIVMGKYLVTLINFLLSTVWCWIYLWIISLLDFVNMDLLNISSLENAFFTSIFSLSIILPPLFILPPKIARYFSMFVYIFIFSMMFSKVEKLFHVNLFQGARGYIIGLVVYLISMGISVLLYENRDLV